MHPHSTYLSRCGGVLFATALALSACSDEPTSPTATLNQSVQPGSSATVDVLILDQPPNWAGSATPALVTALTNAGFNVTVAPVPHYQWNGTNPPLDDFEAVIYLNGGNVVRPLPPSPAGQAALEAYVAAGGGFIGTQYLGHQRGISVRGMNNLILMGGWRLDTGCAHPPPWGVGCGTMQFAVVPGQELHPVVAGVQPLVGYIDNYEIDEPVTFATDPSRPLMELSGVGPCVLARQITGGGRIVNFCWAPNSNSSRTLAEPSIQQIFVNAVNWVAGVTGDPPPNNRPPTASVASVWSGGEGQPIYYTGTGTDPDGDPLMAVWTFGHGSGSQPAFTASHMFPDNGSYTGTLIVRDIHDASSTPVTFTTNVSNVVPVVYAGGPYSILQGQSLMLDGWFNDVGNDFPWTVDIDWGCGQQTRFQQSYQVVRPTSPPGCYDTPSATPYPITVVVTDKDGGVSTPASTQVTVGEFNNHPPTASVAPSWTAIEGAALAFTGTGSDPDGDPLGASWNFGDASAPASGFTPTHVFADNGSYNGTFTVTDPYSETASASFVTTVSNAAPTATVGGPYVVVLGQRLTISGSLGDAGVNDNPWTIDVDWGCGQQTHGQLQRTGTYTATSPAGCYDTPSSTPYPITVVMTDKDGGVSTPARTQVLTQDPPTCSTMLGDLIPKSTSNNVSQNLGIGAKNVGYAVFSSQSCDASRIDPASVRVGSTPLALELDGSYNVWFTDVNHDGMLDAFMFFSRAALFASGDLMPSSTLFVVNGLIAGVPFASQDVVHVVP